MEIVRETPRLILRKYTIEDVPLLHAITSNAETMTFYPAPFTIEQSTVWIERSLCGYEEFGFGRYAILLKETGEYIGCAGYFRTSVNDVMENDLGYFVARNHWRNGYATEAAQGCIDKAREKGWFHRIVIQMAHDHERSRLVAERLGARLETQFINKRNRDKLTDLFVFNL